jgi:V-type H+-transporting ATPase subunit D
MQIAAFSLAEVTYAVGGDIGYQVQESAKSARFRVRTKQENVSGVFLPAFESYTTEGNNDFGLTGLGKGGQQVQRCRETYARAVETLVELASLQVCCPGRVQSRGCDLVWIDGGLIYEFIRRHS